MSAIILDGKELSRISEESIKKKVQELSSQNIKPTLATILVGNDPASETYVKMKRNTCSRVGMESIAVELPENTSTEELLNSIEKLNKDSNVQEYANRYIQSYITSRRDNDEKEIVEMQNEIKIESGQLNMKDAVGAIFDKEYRANTIRTGEIHGKEFLKKCKKFIKIK